MSSSKVLPYGSLSKSQHAETTSHVCAASNRVGRIFKARSATIPATEVTERVITAMNTMQSMLIQFYIPCKSVTLKYVTLWWATVEYYVQKQFNTSTDWQANFNEKNNRVKCLVEIATPSQSKMGNLSQTFLHCNKQLAQTP